MKIREARQEDVPAMAALLGELFSIELDFKIDASKQIRGLERIVADPERACVMVADDGSGKVVGMVSVQLVVSTAEGAFSGWVEDMIVAKDWRRKGVARALLEGVMAWGKKKGATRFQLLADKNNDPALDFYKRLGWSGTSMICLRKSARE